MRNVLGLAIFLFTAMPGLAVAADNDGDGVDEATDCDDNDAANFPGNLEICDGQDNDCNGYADFGVGGWEQLTGMAILNSDYTKGNLFLASQATVISSFGMYLDVSNGATLTLTLGEASAIGGPYTILASQALGVVPGGAQMHTAAGLGVIVTPGQYYWLGATWSGGNCDNFYAFGGADEDPSWGTFETGAWTSSNLAPVNGWTPDSMPGGAYRGEINGAAVGEEDLDGDLYPACADCDDDDPLIHPGAFEICDGLDNDCVGGPDFDLFGELDLDLDGWRTCDADCDDSDDLAYPGAPEICDGEDNDCNGLSDFDVAGEVDIDADTFLSCEDCDDTDPFVRPGALERCDGLDNDCNGIADFGGAPDEVDLDGDGWWDCEDCDDDNAAINRDATEICDGLDNDCDGSANFDGPDGERDADLDGVVACEDCDDDDPNTWPGAEELCDGIDNDCDFADPSQELSDQDGDTFSVCDGDCDDGNSAIYVGAAEICDELDNDCDGAVDNTDECDDLAAEAAKVGSCGCSTNGGHSSGLMLLLLSLAVARRSRAREVSRRRVG